MAEEDAQNPLLAQNRLLEQQLERANERIAALQYDLSLLHSFSTSIVAALGNKAHWEAQAINVANTWREKNQALASELQLAQVGLTSGCGCPIGQCLKRSPDAGSCWLQWAESHISRRQADRHIQELVTNGTHPSRFAQARAEGKNPERLRSPDPGPAAR